MRQKYHLHNWEFWLLKRLRSLRKTMIGRIVQEKVLDHPRFKIPFQAIPLWIASALTGLIAVGYENLFKWFETLGKSIFSSQPLLIFITAPVFFVASWLIVYRLAPYAKGSGIPQLMASVDLAGTSRSHFISLFLSVRIALVKIGSSLLIMLGGGAIGREGPTLQVSGSVFDLVYRLIPDSWPRVSHRIMLITGGASGLAAAFNTPLGGIVYVIEELTKSHIARFRTAVFSAVIIAGITAQNFLGAYLYLGYPRVDPFPVWMLWALALVAFIAGYAGAWFTQSLLWLSRIRSRFPKRSHQLLFVLTLSLVFAVLCFFTGTVSMGTGKSVINEILFNGASSVPLYSFPARFIGSSLSFSAGGGGGIFATALASGASLGALIVGPLGLTADHHNLLILGSMIAFLTGVTRTPFTSAILVLEMTDRHSAIFYFLLAGIIGNLAAGFVMDKSFYEIQKEDYLEKLHHQNPPPAAEGASV